MKKILLLSITSLAMLMADFTLEGSKLTPVSDTIAPTIDQPASTSGIIPNSTNLIWADMHDVPTGYPAAETAARKQYVGANFFPVLSNPKVPGAAKLNAWYELLEGTDLETGAPNTLKGCQLTGLRSSNTVVELSKMVLYWMDNNGVWYKLTDKDRALITPTLPNPAILQDAQRGCNIQSVQQIRTDHSTYNTFVGSTPEDTYKIYPQYYRWSHGYAQGSYGYNNSTIKAVYVGQYARVVLKDPNGPDDRHLSNFVIHISSDIKAADGGMVPGYEMYGVGGISKYKKIPTNGDWMPINFIGGVTEAEIAANPPPFITSPY